ncbi:MAG: ComEC/Rec2 family competence protein [Clostridia bacterium]|nr:ComEC/Rec2 family competence protein [Clostridia bacterium]
MIYLSLIVLIISIFALFYKPKLLSVLLAALVVFFLGEGRMLLGMHQRDRHVEAYDGKIYNTKLTATDFSSNNSFPAQMKIDGRKIKAYIYIENCPEIFPGDIVKAEISLSAPQKDRNSQTDFNTYLSGRNIFISGYAEDCTKVSQDESIINGTVYKIRRTLGEISEKYFKGDVKGLYNAMVYGDKRFLSQNLKDVLQKAGQNHIAVVSGMHLSVMTSVVMMLLGFVFGKRRIGNVICIFAVLFMTVITGAGASVLRACIMCVIYHLSKILFRESDSLTSLCTSAFLMALYNPFVINNVGFILSVLSVLGIILYTEKFTCFFMKIMPKTPASATAVCASAQMTVIPAVMYYFGVLTPYALIANLLVFLLATVVVVSGIALAAFSWVPIVSTVLCALTEAAAHTIIWVCSFMARLPYASVSTGGLSLGVLLCFGALLVVIKVYPKHKNLLLKITAAAVCLCVAAVAFKSGKIRVKYLDYICDGVAYIELEGGKSMIVGCVDSEDALSLAERYSSGKFECVMQTHRDAREILKLAEAGCAKKVILNKRIVGNTVMKRMEKTDAEVILLEENQEYQLEGLTLSYEETGVKTKNTIARIDGKTESAVFLHSLTNEDIKAVYDSGKIINSTYYCHGTAFSREEDMLGGINKGKAKQKFFLKR